MGDKRFCGTTEQEAVDPPPPLAADDEKGLRAVGSGMAQSGYDVAADVADRSVLRHQRAQYFGRGVLPGPHPYACVESGDEFQVGRIRDHVDHLD